MFINIKYKVKVHLINKTKALLYINYPFHRFGHKEFIKKHDRYLNSLQNTETEKVPHAVFIPNMYHKKKKK